MGEESVTSSLGHFKVSVFFLSFFFEEMRKSEQCFACLKLLAYVILPSGGLRFVS